MTNRRHESMWGRGDTGTRSGGDAQSSVPEGLRSFTGELNWLVWPAERSRSCRMRRCPSAIAPTPPPGAQG